MVLFENKPISVHFSEVGFGGGLVAKISATDNREGKRQSLASSVIQTQANSISV